jgi:hypothetical protein
MKIDTVLYVGKTTLQTSGKDAKSHSNLVGKIQNHTLNEWERYKTTLRTSGKDTKPHSERVGKSIYIYPFSIRSTANVSDLTALGVIEENDDDDIKPILLTKSEGRPAVTEFKLKINLNNGGEFLEWFRSEFRENTLETGVKDSEYYRKNVKTNRAPFAYVTVTGL